MEETITRITELGVPFLLNLIAAIVIYIVGKWLAKVISTAIEKLMLNGKVGQALASFTKNIINAVILIPAGIPRL